MSSSGRAGLGRPSPADLDGFLANGQRCASGEHRHQPGQTFAVYCDSYLNDNWILVR